MYIHIHKKITTCCCQPFRYIQNYVCSFVCPPPPPARVQFIGRSTDKIEITGGVSNRNRQQEQHTTSNIIRSLRPPPVWPSSTTASHPPTTIHKGNQTTGIRSRCRRCRLPQKQSAKHNNNNNNIINIIIRATHSSTSFPFAGCRTNIHTQIPPIFSTSHYYHNIQQIQQIQHAIS